MSRRLRDVPLPLIAAGLVSLGYSAVAARSATRVAPNVTAPTVLFYPGPTIVLPESAPLTYQVSGTTSASIDQGVGNVPVPPPGTWATVTVHPTVTTTYTMTAVGPGGTATASSTVKVQPLIALFRVFPAQISAGQTTYLTWSITRLSAAASIDQGIGTVSPQPPPIPGIAVTPTRTTTYKLTATYSGVTETQTATVVVATPPNVIVSSLPAAMLEAPNTGGATASFTISNSGSTATTVTIAPQGDFFTAASQNVSLPGNAAATVTITGLPKPAGTYDGTITLSGSGVAAGTSVPIRMLVPVPPAGTAVATPVSTRIDVAADATSNTVTGTAQFTNTGASTVTAIVSTDVPWIIPPTGIVTIAAGQTVDITFTIDRSKRPDSGTLSGSLSGGLFLTYLGGPAGAGKGAPLDSTTTIISVSLVKIVDTVKPPVQPGSPASLAAGEVALYVVGVGHLTSASHVFSSDIAILNALGTRDLSSLTIFQLPAGGTSASATLSGVPAAGSVQLADITKNVFNNSSALASLQVRGTDVANVAIAATRVDLHNAAGTIGTSLPALRSDRAAAAGENIVLSGVTRTATTSTDILLQEATGAAATVTINFYDASGATKTPLTVSLKPFEFQSLTNAVPPDAVLAVVSNGASSAGKLLAYAVAADTTTGDTWTIVDWTRQSGITSGEQQMIPIAGAHAGLNNTFFRTDLALSNASDIPAGGTLRFFAAAAAPARTDKRIAIPAHATTILSDVTTNGLGLGDGALGYLVFIPDAGSAISLTARSYNATPTGNFSAALPVIGTTSFALVADKSKRIGAIEDASPSVVANGTPATFRTNVGLVETSGQAVTVKISLLFDEIQTTTIARRYGSQTVTILPNEAIVLNGIANMIIGKDRAAFGELRNIQVQFEVIGGAGSVVVFTSTVDNGTGDAIVRLE